VFVLALFVLFSGAAIKPAMAHEIGTTRVTIAVDDTGAYDVGVITDAAALAEKLETLAGRTLPADSAAGRLMEVLTRDQALLRQRLHLTFDDVEAQPAISISVVPATGPLSAPAATLRLKGMVPASASRLTWRYGWTFSTYSIEVQKTDGDSRTEWLDGDETSAPIPLDARLQRASRASVVWQYLSLGFTHIIPKGLDHILFVLGLFLLSANQEGTPLRRAGRQGALVWQVSAFTLAHTLTLGLAMNGIVAARPSIVEPLIALSIAYVAVENIFSARLRPWRVALVFAFGLLHGLGFAGVLGELGLPSGQFLPALLAFNLGVEGGQLAVIAAAALVVGWWRTAPFYRQRIVVPASMAIACVALYWTAQRIGL
jgi:hypothetical protein